jgi:S-disulfanyl-L-cysteine oxidoreductase SoxD
MIKSANFKKYLVGISVTGAILLSGCMAANTSTPGESAGNVKKAVDGAVIYPVKDGKYTLYDQAKLKYKVRYGRVPTKAEMAAWNVDVRYDNKWLPKGHGSVSEGENIFNNQCAVCHGPFGSGGLGYPTLSGGTVSSLKNQMLHGTGEPPVKTIGSYWPYASTLFWYVKTGMPFPHPKSLNDNQVYAVVAYLLYVNNITINGKELDEDYVLDQKRFKEIKMPNRDGFYPDVNAPGKQGEMNMKDFLSHPENYGKGTACMHNCIKGGAKKHLVRIQYAITGFIPPMKLGYDLPKPKNPPKNAFGEEVYKNSCAVCHGNDNMGAPMFGNKKEWAPYLKKGMKAVYSNAIHGIGGMPPKGGTSLTDAKFKEVVDYMVNASK